ncbi:hypothetical protein [Modestobacter italicus]|uniref:hypothetical protein n=1 Tax=Modestobacter italicus (strain DSM 44449 / CECT 9708 / BC 501) TaxID=2732864 RepID=UPI001C95D8FA|nr:hypothetical protein [Modestobacter italicus]
MLILTPTPSQTAAERAFFAELAGWDTGSGVRGALMAALPIVEGPMQRRQSDAVLFVPEGVAVVRVVEVERQSGVVTATPEGAWTIGSGDGPGDVLQLAGGGSTPLDGLMRAGMHVAVTLRKAGLEPGRVARLTVLTGAVTGLVPADGDLGEGDQVATLDSRSLLLGVARASRHAGTDNPRLWTTADVRAAVEALGVGGRTPSVEELNGEGFPYSPYVLRRPDLLTPAALNASPSRIAAPATGAAPAVAPATATELPRPAPGGPLVDPAAAARVAAAAVHAQEQAESQASGHAQEQAEAHERAREQAEAQQRAEGQAQEQAGRRPAVPMATGLSVAQPVGGPGEPRSSVFPTARAGDTQALVPEPPAAAPDRPQSSAEDTGGGIGGLFSGPAAAAPAPRRELPPELQPRRPAVQAAPRGSSAAGQGGRPSGRWRVLAFVVAGLVLVAVLVVVGVRSLTSDGGGAANADPGSSSAPAEDPAPAGPVVGSTEVVNDVTFTLQATQVDATCQGHAYDAVAGFFERTDCAGLDRSLWSAQAGGQPAVVSLARVTMPDDASAQALRSLADTDGSGNVSDLLREGVSWEGGPTALSRAQYASSQQDATVTIVETSWTGEAGPTSALDALASSALSLPTDTTTTSD